MTSYEFEVAAKNAVIDALKDFHIEATIADLQLVWFAHLIGNKKCMVWGPPMKSMYAEVTYSIESGMVYVDMYEKKSHKQLHMYEIDTEVHME